MGAWGTGIFDNDTACDWAYSLEESRDLSVVESALDRVLSAGADYLESPDAEEALAACEVVARLQGNFGERNSYTEPADLWVATSKLEAPPKLAKKALAAIERILAEPSGIVDLWKEGDEYGAWEAGVKDLKSRIRA
jgi:Domain of unknown function (DUF4259)